MIRLRAQVADMRAAVAAALADALCGNAAPPGAEAAGQAVADAVTTHAASFAPQAEPAYHDLHHQVEATVAMGWLCAEASRLGLLAPQDAAAGVLAMAGHDLQHDGSVPPPGVLEARSADLTVDLAARAGLGATTQATIRHVILATDPARALAPDDLLGHLAREADLFGSLTPELGWRLGQALAREEHAARFQPAPPVESFAGRLLLLRTHRSASAPGRRLGLDDAVAAQLAALAVFGEGDAEQGASRLDAFPLAEARARYLAALASVLPG